MVEVESDFKAALQPLSLCMAVECPLLITSSIRSYWLGTG